MPPAERRTRSSRMLGRLKGPQNGITELVIRASDSVHYCPIFAPKGVVRSMSHNWPGALKLDNLIDSARRGSTAAMGDLFEECRDYLLLISNCELGRDLRAKVGASDLVQQTFVEAQRGFAKFQGTTEAQLLAWLRKILINQLLDVRRCYAGTNKRELSRELSSDGDRAVRRAVASLPCQEVSPRHAISTKEEATVIYEAVAELPDDYRQVILLRHWYDLSFQEIGERLGRTSGAARKLWLRALDCLELDGRLNGAEK